MSDEYYQLGKDFDHETYRLMKETNHPRTLVYLAQNMTTPMERASNILKQIDDACEPKPKPQVVEVNNLERQVNKLQEQHQTPKKSSTTSKPERLGRARQIELIDNKLRELEYEPEKILAGKSGARALRGQVKEALANEPEFAKETAFKGAWQDFINRNKKIREREKEKRLQKNMPLKNLVRPA